MLNGIFWILRSGAAWRDLPERYGPWQTVYKRFVKWSKAGIFEKIFQDLAADADMQDISIDSTCIKAHKASAGAFPDKVEPGAHYYVFLRGMIGLVVFRK